MAEVAAQIQSKELEIQELKENIKSMHRVGRHCLKRYDRLLLCDGHDEIEGFVKTRAVPELK